MCCVLLAVGDARAGDERGSGWERVRASEGILIERKSVPGTSAYAVRATARCPVPPAQLFQTLWKHNEYVQFVPGLKALTILEDAGDSRLIYEQTRLPLVKDRDYTVRVRRLIDPGTQVHRILITSSDQGPPPNGDHVRVASIQGSWTLEPIELGTAATVTYELTSDPGGLLPMFVVNAAQQRTLPDLIRAMIDRAVAQQHP